MQNVQATGDGEWTGDPGCEYDPEQHELLSDGPWVAMVRRELKKPDFFVYRHKKHHNFVCAVWLARSPSGWGRFLEFHILPHHPEQPSLKSRDAFEDEQMPSPLFLRNAMKPMVEFMADLEMHNRRVRSAERSEKQELAEARADRVKHLRRKGDGELADLIDEGVVPWARPNAEMSELYREAMSSRISRVVDGSRNAVGAEGVSDGGQSA